MEVECTYTLKNTKKEKNWCKEDGALRVAGAAAKLVSEDGEAVASTALGGAQLLALQSRGWLGGERTEESELKLQFPGTTITAMVLSLIHI